MNLKQIFFLASIATVVLLIFATALAYAGVMLQTALFSIGLAVLVVLGTLASVIIIQWIYNKLD